MKKVILLIILNSLLFVNKADANPSSTEQYLNVFGINSYQYRTFLLQNINNPSYIYNTSGYYGVSNSMLSDIVGNGVTEYDVQYFFYVYGFNPYNLDVISYIKKLLVNSYLSKVTVQTPM